MHVKKLKISSKFTTVVCMAEEAITIKLLKTSIHSAQTMSAMHVVAEVPFCTQTRF